MSDRHEKWTRVEPGTVIPAGQPIRFEYADGPDYTAMEKANKTTHDVQPGPNCTGLFVDSSWRPPLELPTAPSVIRATVNGSGRLLYGPLGNGIDKDWCDAANGYAVLDQDIDSFEILWTEEA